MTKKVMFLLRTLSNVPAGTSDRTIANCFLIGVVLGMAQVLGLSAPYEHGRTDRG